MSNGAAAAKQLDVPAGDLSLKDGVFRSISGSNKKVAYENILWALLNTKEFLFNK